MAATAPCPFLADAATFLVAADCAVLDRQLLPTPARSCSPHLLRDVRDGLGRRTQPMDRFAGPTALTTARSRYLHVRSPLSR
jgi:hypothetical protein